MLKIIGIAGNKNSGKSTIADELEHKFICSGSPSKVFAFADPFKRGLMEMFKCYGINYNDLWGPSENRKKTIPLKLNNTEELVTIRKLLQTIGTEWGQNCINKRIWIEITMKEIENQIRSGFPIVSDCRFIEEVKEIKNRDGIVIFIDRKTNESSEHLSEQELNSKEFHNCVDYYINNNKDFPFLFEQTDSIYKEIVNQNRSQAW